MTRIKDGLKSYFDDDVRLFMGGWFALAYSIYFLFFSIWKSNIVPHDLGTTAVSFWTSKQGYGPEMLLNGGLIIIGVFALFRLIESGESKLYEILLVAGAIVLLATSLMLTYYWGVEHNLSMFDIWPNKDAV